MRRPDSVGAPAFVATHKGPFVINGFPGLYFCKIYRAYNTVLSINIMYGRLRALLEGNHYGYNEGLNDLWFLVWL